jgi:hypothetical protein
MMHSNRNYREEIPPDLDLEDSLNVLRLLSALGRMGASAEIAGSKDASLWGSLEEVISFWTDREDRQKAAKLREREISMGRITTILLDDTDRTGGRTAAYRGLLKEMVRCRRAWVHRGLEHSLTIHLHEAFLWHTAWHLLASGRGIKRVVRLMKGDIPPAPRRAWNLAALAGQWPQPVGSTQLAIPEHAPPPREAIAPQTMPEDLPERMEAMPSHSAASADELSETRELRALAAVQGPAAGPTTLTVDDILLRGSMTAVLRSMLAAGWQKSP